MIKRCWDKDPNIRPEFEEIAKYFEDPSNWIEGTNPDDFENYKSKIEYAEEEKDLIFYKTNHLYTPIKPTSDH